MLPTIKMLEEQLWFSVVILGKGIAVIWNKPDKFDGGGWKRLRLSRGTGLHIQSTAGLRNSAVDHNVAVEQSRDEVADGGPAHGVETSRARDSVLR